MKTSWIKDGDTVEVEIESVGVLRITRSSLGNNLLAPVDLSLA